MLKKLILGGLIGGVIIYAWGVVSWMVLPFHSKSMEKFKDDVAMQETIMMNVDKAGIYMLPTCPMKRGTADPAALKELKKQACAQFETGPVVYSVINPKGIGPMWQSMTKGFAIQLLGALLAVWLLLQANLKSYFRRVIFITVFSVAVAVLAYLPAWNWWGYPCFATLVDMADVVIAYVIASFAIAKVTR